LVPRDETRRALQGVERTVDLDRVQAAGRVLQLTPVRQPRRVELAAPPWIGPAGDPDSRRGGGLRHPRSTASVSRICMMCIPAARVTMTVVADISVLVVDDHHLFADALQARLAQETDLGPW